MKKTFSLLIPMTLCNRNNAKVYQVEKYVDFVQDNIWTFLRRIANYGSFERYAKTLQKLDRRKYGGVTEDGEESSFDLDQLFKYPLSLPILEDTIPEDHSNEAEALVVEVNSRKPEKDGMPKEPKRRKIGFDLGSPDSDKIFGHEKSSPREFNYEGNCRPLLKLVDPNLEDRVEPLVKFSSSSHSYHFQQSLYDLVILSPPWGGPDYLSIPHYDLRMMLTSGDCYYLAALTAAVTDFFVLILPRNTPNESMTEICNIIHYQCVIENIYMHDKCKVKVCYFYRN
jgi:hypothetical protein